MFCRPALFCWKLFNVFTYSAHNSANRVSHSFRTCMVLGFEVFYLTYIVPFPLIIKVKLTTFSIAYIKIMQTLEPSLDFRSSILAQIYCHNIFSHKVGKFIFIYSRFAKNFLKNLHPQILKCLIFVYCVMRAFIFSIRI